MKKIIWLAFAVLSVLWTGLVALILQLSDWLLDTVAASRLPGTLAEPGPWTPPAWAEPWVGTGLLESLQAAAVWLMNGVNQILPAFGGLGTVIAVVGWIIWGMVMALMLAVALVLHWAAGRRQSSGGAIRA
ncbi:hypothetical protein [Bordetella petrii]|uniref:hypothetical protein n=1 Tax=Bordetella petrii TaxID=94624 RepID=UPI00048AD4CF|nr:hypothetical protein [Bordetella petrii]